jgi:hypothetical protein
MIFWAVGLSDSFAHLFSMYWYQVAPLKSLQGTRYNCTSFRSLFGDSRSLSPFRTVLQCSVFKFYRYGMVPGSLTPSRSLPALLYSIGVLYMSNAHPSLTRRRFFCLPAFGLSSLGSSVSAPTPRRLCSRDRLLGDFKVVHTVHRCG